MPNHCSNDILVRGSAKELKEFDNKFKAKYSYYEQIFLHDENIKRFEELKKTVAESDIKYADETTVYVKQHTEGYSFNNFIPIPDEEAVNWYNWNNDNWGTKWNIYDNSESGLDLVDDALKNNELDAEIEINYDFNTAWAPCEPIVLAMSKAFPNLFFKHTYDECGCEIAGVVDYLGGEEVERSEPEQDKYREFMRDVVGYEGYIYECEACGRPIDESEFDDEEECTCGCTSFIEYGAVVKEFLNS